MTFLPLDALQEGRNANLSSSIRVLPKVQFAGVQPLLELGRCGCFRQALAAQSDDIYIGVARGAPG